MTLALGAGAATVQPYSSVVVRTDALAAVERAGRYYLSLGWGVQSFALATMAAVGRIPLDAAIHADTGHEYGATYAFAEKWTPWLEARGMRVVRVQGAPHRQIGPQVERYRAVPIPASAVNSKGGLGRLNRHCTQDWKVRPIQQWIRRQLVRGEVATQVLGISFDEWTRARSSSVKYLRHEYPLIGARLTREDCVAWLRHIGVDVPPKSACVFCPYHDRRAWVALIDGGGPDLARAVAVDESIRHARRYPVYVHPSGRPLAEIRTPKGLGFAQSDMFEQEVDDELGPCEGGHCHA